MDKERKITSVTIVNRNYPPSQGITGRSACDLAEFLEKKGDVDIHVVHVNTVYKGREEVRKPTGHVHKVKPFYNGSNKLLRLFGNLTEGYVLIRKALQIDSDLIICMTDPPLLVFWASLFLKKRNRRWILWSMDLYPQAFVAAGLIGQRNLLYKFSKRISYSFIPDRLIALGPQQKIYINNIYKQSIHGYLLPCGIFFSKSTTNYNGNNPEWAQEDKIIFGYCGNLGEAHSSDFLLTFINEIDPQKHLLILSLYGSKSELVNKFARSKPGIIFLPTVPQHLLKFIDVHLVSLLKEWNHICVPSKAVSAVCSGGTILFCGNEESDNWHLLKDAGWFINIDDNLSDQIKTIIGQITSRTLEDKKKHASNIAAMLNKLTDESYERIYQFITDPCD